MSGDTIGEALVAIRPDTTDFSAELNAQLESTGGSTGRRSSRACRARSMRTCSGSRPRAVRPEWLQQTSTLRGPPRAAGQGILDFGSSAQTAGVDAATLGTGAQGAEADLSSLKARRERLAPPTCRRLRTSAQTAGDGPGEPRAERAVADPPAWGPTRPRLEPISRASEPTPGARRLDWGTWPPQPRT